MTDNYCPTHGSNYEPACIACQKIGPSADDRSWVINKYGAFCGEAIDDMDIDLYDLEKAIDVVCATLNPVEVRLLGLYIAERISGKFAEIVLRKAVEMRKSERETNG